MPMTSRPKLRPLNDPPTPFCLFIGSLSLKSSSVTGRYIRIAPHLPVLLTSAGGSVVSHVFVLLDVADTRSRQSSFPQYFGHIPKNRTHRYPSLIWTPVVLFSPHAT